MSGLWDTEGPSNSRVRLLFPVSLIERDVPAAGLIEVRADGVAQPVWPVLPLLFIGGIMPQRADVLMDVPPPGGGTLIEVQYTPPPFAIESQSGGFAKPFAFTFVMP